MLKENIFYKENLPVNCSVMNLKEYPIHFHNDMEVVYVLSGNVVLKNGYYKYEMKEGDIYILNDREIHSYYSLGEPNVVLILQLSLSYFSQYYETLKNSFFVTDVDDPHDENLEELRELLARIALENMSERKDYEKRVINLAHNLINCLVSYFQYFAMEDGRFINESKNKGNKILAGRLKRIIEYMYENYNRRLTLSEIADREHLSIYYLSHFIKEATGLGFQELLGFIRVEESEKLVLGTDKKISEISMESGFSAVRYYIKYFEKWFGMHPTDYRREYTDQVRGRDTTANFMLLEGGEVEDLLCRHVDDVFSVAYKNRTEVMSAEFDTDEYVWVENNFQSLFTSLLNADFMKPIVEILNDIELRYEHVVSGAPGYFIMRSFTEEKGQEQPLYGILFYNFSDKLIQTIYEHSQNQVLEELEKHEKQTEYYIKLIGVSGQFRIARCKFSKEAILARYGKSTDGEGLMCKRERLAKAWSSSPSFSVKEFTASQVLGVQSQQHGSSMELVLIDPV